MTKIAFAALIIILGLINWSIAQKEAHLSEGTIVYLKTAPIDPRSLMQGDYMALRFDISNQVYSELNAMDKLNKSLDGYAVVSLDEQRVASFKSIYAEQALADNEIILEFRVRNNKVKFATNAFFFQEGDSGRYNPARFGQFRVNKDGEMLLVAMFNKDMKNLKNDIP